MKSRQVSLILSFVLFLLSRPVQAQDALALYKEGVDLKTQKKPKEALEKFKRALVLKPDYPDASYEAGWCQNDLRDYSGAIVSLRQARNGWPRIPKVFFELGYAFEKTAMTDSAIASYNQCLQLNPDYSGAYRQLGYIAYEKDQFALALEKFRVFEQRTKTPPQEYLYWYRKGYMLNATKQYDSAKVALQRSLNVKKDHTNTYYELGFAATKLLQADEAIGYFNSAISLDPKSHIPYNGIGEVYRDIKKDMDMAMTWYGKALQLNINERKANFGMGYCLNAKGRMEAAIAYLRRAVVAEPTYTAAYVELGYSLYKTKNYTEGVSNLRKAIELNPKNENAHYYLVNLYVEQKDKVNAQKWLNALRTLNSKHVATLEPKVNAL